jgi:tight adherence protein B
MPRPASEEFGRVVREIGLGIANAQALQNLVRRVRSDDLDLMVTAMTIQYEVGGNLAMILETIGATIRDRIRLKGEVRTLTVQQRLTRVILTGLPFFLAVVMYMINPEYIGALFTPGPTLLIPIGSLVFLGLGWVVMGKMADIQF